MCCPLASTLFNFRWHHYLWCVLCYAVYFNYQLSLRYQAYIYIYIYIYMCVCVSMQLDCDVIIVIRMVQHFFPHHWRQQVHTEHICWHTSSIGGGQVICSCGLSVTHLRNILVAVMYMAITW